MIRHFLRRDFRDCRLYWASLLLITVASLFAGVIGLTILFWVYFMFPSMAQGYILGSPWRTQHQMSRHYLLALPISHKKLFVIQQARMLVFLATVLNFRRLFAVYHTKFATSLRLLLLRFVRFDPCFYAFTDLVRP
jgi:hypothetical protein